MSIQLENRTDNHIADETFLINHQNGVDNWTVKVEVLENASECLGTVQSRLKRAIINRRLFNGLGEIDTRCFESAVPECKVHDVDFNVKFEIRNTFVQLKYIITLLISHVFIHIYVFICIYIHIMKKEKTLYIYIITVVTR